MNWPVVTGDSAGNHYAASLDPTPDSVAIPATESGDGTGWPEMGLNRIVQEIEKSAALLAAVLAQTDPQLTDAIRQ